MRFFSEDMWESDYDLAYGLFRGNAECQFKAGNVETAVQHTNILLEKARDEIDKAEILYLHIIQLDVLGKFQESDQRIREGLTLFNIHLPDNEEDAKYEVDKAMKIVEDNLRGKEIEDLINLPNMSDLRIKQYSKLLTFFNTYIMLSKIHIIDLLGLKSINNSLLYGNVESSVIGYIGYAMILIRHGEYDKGYRFGLLAINLNKKFNDKLFKTLVLHSFGQFINHWSSHIKSSITILAEAIDTSLETGDKNFASYAAYVRFLLQIFTGEKLYSLVKESTQYFISLNKFYNWIGNFTNVIIHCCLNLQGKTQDRLSLNSNEFNEDDYDKQTAKIPIMNYYYKTLKLFILFIYGSYNDAFKLVLEILKNISIFSTRYILTEVYFYYAMCITQLFQEFTDEERLFYCSELDDCISKMKTWEGNCPENFLHKYMLMSAEKARIEGSDLKAMELYDRAVDLAKQNEFLNNEAMANELAGAYYLNKGRHKIAKIYMTEASYLYNQWGATQKVRDLEERYPDLLVSTKV
jgi:predicted ATPase